MRTRLEMLLTIFYLESCQNICLEAYQNTCLSKTYSLRPPKSVRLALDFFPKISVHLAPPLVIYHSPPWSTPQGHHTERQPNPLVLPQIEAGLPPLPQTLSLPIQCHITESQSSNPTPLLVMQRLMAAGPYKPPVGCASNRIHGRRRRRRSRRWPASQGCRDDRRRNTRPRRIWIWRPSPCSGSQVPSSSALEDQSGSAERRRSKKFQVPRAGRWSRGWR